MVIKNALERLVLEYTIEKRYYEDTREQKNCLKKIAAGLKRGDMQNSKELWGEDAEEYAVFCQYSDHIFSSDLFEELDVHIPEQNEYEKYNIIIFVKTFQEKVEARKYIREIRDYVKKKLGCGLSVIECQIINYWNNQKKQFWISIGNRVNRMEMPEKENEILCMKQEAIPRRIKAYTFTASLFDIVKMYNEIGDELFRQNVRFAIKDELDVEENIKKTLRECPEDFWYLNNGVTIIVQDANALNLDKTSRIGLDYSNYQIISVINGAQTISTAAKFWFEDTGNLDSDQNDSDLRKYAEEKTKVLLRIMCVSDSQEDCQNDLERISISLNRQKPIKSEDIAYTNPVVWEINQLCQPATLDEYHFRIVKRGEGTMGIYSYNLTDFARAVKAYRIQKPGEARTQTSNRILQYESGDPTSIYAEEILRNDAEAVFAKYYKPTNFVMRALNYYKEYGKRSDQKEHKNAPAILGNGKYYFAAFLVYVLHENTDDFTDFNYSLSKLDEDFDVCMRKYVRILGKISDEYIKKVDEEFIESNTFKSEKLYQMLINYEEDGETKTIKTELEKLKMNIREWFSD